MTFNCPQSLARSDLWFSDGNIVLLAGNVVFKVHRGQLERHSEIFQDLFSIPQPTNQELFDGCAWVELHDSPSDILHLLRALYDGLYFDKICSEDFIILASVLRLSTKYLIEHLRQRCLARLRSDWPDTLSGWDLREMQATDTGGRYSPRDTYPHPILVVNLIRELDLIEFLPAALYDLARYGPRRIVAGTPALTPVSLSPPTDPKERPPKPDILHLEHGDLHTILLGREAAQRHLATFIETELVSRPISENCTNRHHDAGRLCRESCYYIMLNVLRAVGGISHGRDADPLYSLVQAVEMLSRTDFSDGVRQCGLKMCMACKTDLTECVDNARLEVWSNIPGWFGLPGWKDEEMSEPDVCKPL